MMAQMKFLSLNLIKSIKVLNLILIIFLLFVLSSCQKDEYPRPTNAYYINDFANILYEATRDSIRREGERLYDWTQDETDGGAQLVIATFEVETEEDIANYDKTDLYRQWRIGDDDMGVLVILFFVPFIENEITYLELIETQIEVGYRMEQYLTPTQLGAIIDSTLYSDEDVELDVAVMHMVYELLSAIYIDIYDYITFDYDLEVFEQYLIDHPDSSSDDEVSMGWIIYLLSPYATWGERLSIALPFLLFMILGGGIIKNVGGGGSSGGMGIFRRRR
jgi:uncharacterized protein